MPNISGAPTSPTPPISNQEAAFKERRKVAIKTIASSFSLTAACAHHPLIPPNFKWLITPVAAGGIWTAVQNVTKREWVPERPRTLRETIACNTAAFGFFVPAFAAQVYANHPNTRSGQTLQAFTAHWAKCFTKCPLLARYPVGAAGTRILAQVGATIAGAHASTQVDKMNGIEMKKSGHAGKIDWTQSPASVLENPKRFVFNLGLFGLAALGFQPITRVWLQKHLVQKLMSKATPLVQVTTTEFLATTGLVAAAVVSNTERQSHPNKNNTDSNP